MITFDKNLEYEVYIIDWYTAEGKEPTEEDASEGLLYYLHHDDDSIPCWILRGDDSGYVLVDDDSPVFHFYCHADKDPILYSTKDLP